MKASVWLKLLSIVVMILLIILAVNHSHDKNIAEHDALVVAVAIASMSLAYAGWRQMRINRAWRRLRESENWQQKLLREKNTIEGIIEGSPIPTFVIGRDHKIMFWNKACADLMGYDAAEMIGTDKQYLPFYQEKRPVIADLIVDNDIEGLGKFYGKKRVQKSTVVQGAYEASDFYENLGGVSRHLYFLAAPIYDEKGEIFAAIETLQDVTREKELENDLKGYTDTLKSELDKNIQLRTTIEGVIEGSPIPTFVIGRDHRIMFWNKACAELMGYDAREMIGTDKQYLPFYQEKRPVIADLIVDDDIEGLEKYYGKKRVQKSAVVKGAYEARDFYKNLGGRSRHLYFLAAPIYDRKGDIIAAVETLQDVSREEEMATHLKESAETLQDELSENIRLRQEIEAVHHYLQSIVDSSPDTLLDVSGDGIINYVSGDPEKNKGSIFKEIKGKHFAEFVAPEHRALALSVWEDVKKGIYKPFEVEATGRDGRKRSLLVTPRPVERTDRYVFVQRDITEFKNLEKKYYESEKLAAVGQLSAGIAHEVRNPLSSIKMSLQILEKRMQPEGNDLKRFRIAQREVEHLEELVNDVLIYARPAVPKRELSDIRRIIENALALVERLVADKNIHIQADFDDSLPLLDVDAAMLEQVFLNIYRNAVDAMEMDGILHITVRHRGNDRTQLQITVEDNGCGIDAADLPHLYNPFFTKKKYGTGLGMTQVKKIIDLHMGSIEIRSNKGEGTQVMVTLPINQEG
ncbi:MAG: PAS domain S-box protein [Deltaproteobacteria bacterium]|nr:PAS domain S-box protein [Deltaproteobacteria bacterium]